MKLRLKDIKPNPMRDLRVDPLVREHVEVLKVSMQIHGIWQTGVQARRNAAGEYECVFGWHRINAQIDKGEEFGEIDVVKISDQEALARYVMENATQRASTSLSIAGSVAAALRQCLRDNLARDFTSQKQHGGDHGRNGVGEGVVFAKLCEINGGQKIPGIGQNVVKQNLASLKDAGHYDRIAHEVAEEVEAKHVAELARIAETEAKAKAEAERKERARVEAEAARRKADEESARREAETKAAAKARAEAKAQADREAAAKREAEAKRRAEESACRAEEARKAAKAREAEAEEARKKAKAEAERRAIVEKAKTKAVEAKVKAEIDKRPVTFDLKGVGAILKVSHHLETFRTLVTDPKVARYLPVENQAKAAQALVDLAKQRQKDGERKHRGYSSEAEISSDFIKRELEIMLSAPRWLEHIQTKAEKKRAEEELARSAWTKRWDAAVTEVKNFAHGVDTSADKLARLAKERPQGIEVIESYKFTLALTYLRRATKVLERFHQAEAIEVEATPQTYIEADFRDA